MYASITHANVALTEPARLAHDLHWVLSSGVHWILALLGGAFIARSLRAKGLHWSWPLPVIFLSVLARPMHGAAASLMVIAALSAAIRGRRWHREDLDSGGDLAALARSRSAPLSVVGSARAARPHRPVPQAHRALAPAPG